MSLRLLRLLRVKFLIPLLLALCAGLAQAQAIAVPTSYQGMFASSDPTMTFLFRAPEARATLVFIPGGEGRVKMQADWTAEHRYFSSYHFNVALRSLGDPKTTAARLNLVIFDSPVDLPTANHWSAARTGGEHLTRVEDVVRHYRELLGRPVWVMGHSMGSISVTELYKRLQDNGKAKLTAGLIISGGENGTSLNWATTRLPVLVVHHEQDGCAGNTPDHARRLHEKLREAGNAVSELVFIRGGSLTPGNNNPCRSGFHMYYGAGEELAGTLDRFLDKHLDRP